MKIFFDGGWRPAIGQMETAVVARGRLHHRPLLGPGSSERAEWLGLLDALLVARRLGVEDVRLVGDCLSVIHQANGVARCRTAVQRSGFEAFQAEVGLFARVRVNYVARSRNLAGIALARMRDGAGGPV